MSRPRVLIIPTQYHHEVRVLLAAPMDHLGTAEHFRLEPLDLPYGRPRVGDGGASSSTRLGTKPHLRPTIQVSGAALSRLVERVLFGLLSRHDKHVGVQEGRKQE